MARKNRLPVVAIVGRPNVGKSTLFNRLIQNEDAIVHETPGVTRDRHYEMTDWNGRYFMLVDTGGYIPESKSVMDLAVREQAEIAIEEADLVILVVDAQGSLSVAELQIAELLKRTGKANMLIANKADNEKIMQSVSANSELYRLGLGDALTVSAIHGRSIGDLLDMVVDRLGNDYVMTAEDIEQDEESVHIAVIGKPNVGKSSLVNAIVGSQKLIVTDIPGTTRDSIDTDLDYQGTKIKLIDTAGLRRKTKVKENLEFYSTLRTAKTIQACDVAVLILDATEGLAAQDIRVMEQARQLKKGLVLAVNKWDIIMKDGTTSLHYERNLDKALAPTTYIPYVFISAKTGQRVKKVLDLALRVHQERSKSISTAKLNIFLKAAIERNHPPAVRGKDIRINYLTQIKSRPPVFAFFSNFPELIPANYRQYLEKQIRESFGFEGVPLSLTFRKKNKDRHENT